MELQGFAFACAGAVAARGCEKAEDLEIVPVLLLLLAAPLLSHRFVAWAQLPELYQGWGSCA